MLKNPFLPLRTAIISRARRYSHVKMEILLKGQKEKEKEERGRRTKRWKRDKAMKEAVEEGKQKASIQQPRFTLESNR